MEITIRKGNASHVEPMILLLQEVRASMEHKEWLYLDAPEDIRTMMGEGMLELWVAEDGERLAGVLYILFPGLESFNYGYDLGFTREELLRSVSMDTAVVHPDYRGQGLQRRLLQAAEESLKGQGARILLCTIHPQNSFSLQNALRQGYEIQRELPKYGSTRYVLRKNI